MSIILKYNACGLKLHHRSQLMKLPCSKIGNRINSQLSIQCTCDIIVFQFLNQTSCEQIKQYNTLTNKLKTWNNNKQRRYGAVTTIFPH